MAKSLHNCVLLLVTVMAASCTVSVAGIIYKSVCEGESVQVFQNITSASFKKKFTLYKTGVSKQEVIGIWFMNHSSIEDEIQDKYEAKVLFENGSIILRNIESTDEATYALVYDTDGWFDRKETQILALAPPTNPCKPKIRQEDHFLIALLDNQDYCGRPLVSVQWMDYPGISYKDKAVIVVPPGKDACTYYACIEGEALTCARKSTEREYCEHITIGSTRRESIPVPSVDISHLRTITFVIAVIVSLVLLVLIVSPIILWKYCRIVPRDHERVRSDDQLLDQPSLQHRSFPGQNDPEPRHDDPEIEPLS
ncbi:hypothetical protein CHS0354_025617 [Potamilus streckersoni]|uniref:Uncharacterized protein n=1 Tax=Potamilus streckersoni TaxID=2493646 RepID=A0AAE0VML6_9BIVA|nr:hypothetical protein CHS0354_025617 [Potamilus streckersoni]